MIHAVCRGIGRINLLRLLHWLLANDLHPVLVRIKSESDRSHATVFESLLELVTCIRQSLACSLNVVDGNTHMAESLRIFVPVVNLEAGIVFGAIVVCQFDDAFSVRPMIAVRNRLRTVCYQLVETVID